MTIHEILFLSETFTVFSKPIWKPMLGHANNSKIIKYETESVLLTIILLTLTGVHSQLIQSEPVCICVVFRRRVVIYGDPDNSYWTKMQIDQFLQHDYTKRMSRQGGLIPDIKPPPNTHARTRLSTRLHTCTPPFHL